MRYFITLFLILFLALNAVALSEQEYFHTRDSLQNILDHSAGIDRADAIFNLVRFVAYYEPGICDSLIAEEAALAEKYNDTNGLAGTHQNRGDLFYYSNNFSGALENYYNAARLFEEVGNYREAARSYLRVIIVFYFTGNKNKFVGYYQKIIDLYQKCGCSEDLAFFYYLLGFLYNHGDTQPLLAKQYLRKAIGIGEATQMPPIYLAGFNSSLSLACCNQQQYDSAIRYLYKSNSFLNDNSEDVMLHKAINVADLAKVYYLSGNNDSAMYYYKNGIAKAQELSYRFTITRCARGIAKILISENRNEEAVEYYKLAINNVMKINASGQYYASPDKKYDSEWLADAWPGNIKIFSENPKKLWAKGEAALVCYELSALLKSIDQQGEALEYFELYHAFSDTLRQIEKARELINLELGYETEIKDRKIENLSQENQLNQLQIRQSRFFLFGLAGILFIGIILAWLLIRQNKLKHSQKAMQLEQRLLRSQMNPHFIFNSLSSIQHLIVEEESEKASIYLAKFSTLVRNILNGSSHEYITIENEIKTIESYLALQKIRYLKKFDYTVSVDPKIETESLTIPPMLAQPFIENSIEHGMRHKKDMGHIEIRFQLSGDLIIFEVEDDGIGREKAGEIKSKQSLNHQSMATAITLDRLKVLNKKLKKKIELRIIDLKNESGEATGTKVVMEIPFEVV